MNTVITATWATGQVKVWQPASSLVLRALVKSLASTPGIVRVTIVVK